MATTAPTDAGRLEIARAKLAAMGPSARDMTGAQIARRRELEQRIEELEREVAAQLALPIDLPDDPLDLLRSPVNFDDDDRPPWDGRLRLVQ